MSKDTHSKSNLEEIKARVKVWDVLNRFFKCEFPDRDGIYRSPFRDDSHESFSIFRNGEMWKDHATGDSSDIFGLLTANGKTFRQAVSMLGDWCNVKTVRMEIKERQKRELEKLPLVDPEYKKYAKLCRESANGWKDSSNILRQLVKRKRWNPKHVDHLVHMGVLGLHQQSLAWISQRGIKLRHSAFASRGDRWLVGKSNYSTFLDTLFSPQSSIVYLTEGETDAVSILLSGACRQKRASVLGVSGASIKPHPDLIKPMLYGKKVVLVGDNDPAGRRFLKSMDSHLRLMGIIPMCCNWGSLPYNDVSDFAVAEGSAALCDWVTNSSLWTPWSLESSDSQSPTEDCTQTPESTSGLVLP